MALVLTVKPQEKVLITLPGGRQAMVSVKRVRRWESGQVELCFDFPPDVNIVRSSVVARTTEASSGTGVSP